MSDNTPTLLVAGTAYPLMAGPFSGGCTQRYGMLPAPAGLVPLVLGYVQLAQGSQGSSAVTTPVFALNTSPTAEATLSVLNGSSSGRLGWVQVVSSRGGGTQLPGVYALYWSDAVTPTPGPALGTTFDITNQRVVDPAAPGVYTFTPSTLIADGATSTDGSPIQSWMLLAPQPAWAPASEGVVVFASAVDLRAAFVSGDMTGQAVPVSWTFYNPGAYPFTTTSRTPASCVQLCI